MSLDGLLLAANQKLNGVTGDTEGGTLGINHVAATGDVLKSLGQKQLDDFNDLRKPLTITGDDGQPREPKDAEETTVAVLRRGQKGLALVAGSVGAAHAALDMGFGALTSPLAAITPSLPSATMGSLYLGVPHTHAHPPSLIPPAPPVPLPSLGSVLLGNSVQVLLCGSPAARAGDKGIAPTCGGLSPFFEIKLGSSNVFIGGKRAARIGDMCECCTPGSPMGKVAKALLAGAVIATGMGMVADAGEAASLAESNAALAAGKAMSAVAQAAQLVSDAAAMAAVVVDPATSPAKGAIIVPGAPLVLIGGFPMMPTLDFAKAVLGKLKALARPAPDPPAAPEQPGPESCSS